MLNISGPSTRTLLAVALLLVIAFLIWIFYLKDEPLKGVLSGNGRLEVEEVSISTKYAGRVLEVLVDEGDPVTAGDVVARMDTDILAAELKEARAMERKAIKQKDNAKAVLEQRNSEYSLAKQNLERFRKLYRKGIISEETMDEVLTKEESSLALYNAAAAGVEDAKASIEAARARIERFSVQIEENELISPVSGRVQYRLAEPFEVLPAGGRVLTVLDFNDVYMTIFLSTEDSGKIPMGADSRILLDAFPDDPLPSKVTFVASEAQFTPKEVETRSERQKLSFRVKVSLVDGDMSAFKPGMPGEAFILIDGSEGWPPFLK